MYRGVATTTLDYGKCPPWLFERMVKLSREMIYVIIDEYGPSEFVKRMADPVWFQALGTVLAFDWNASGLTTVLTGALKEAIRGQEMDLGLFICGGKGRTSRKTPDQIFEFGELLNFPTDTTDMLIKNSKMSAKVDSALVQDGYSLYHHTFFFSADGAWTVVQQGMNTTNRTARRYHWHDKLFRESKDSRQTKDLLIRNEKVDFVNEPHIGIASQQFGSSVLNLVSKDSNKTRSISAELVQSGYKRIRDDLELLRRHQNAMSKMLSFRAGEDKYTLLKLSSSDFSHHAVELESFSQSKYLDRIFAKLSENSPKSYEDLVATEGVGPKTIRALALVAEVIYGAKPSYEDPARYSFAHGGKDEVPYPVDKDIYDNTIQKLQEVVRRSKISDSEKDRAQRRLAGL